MVCGFFFSSRISEKDIKGFEGIIHIASLSNDPLCEFKPNLTNDINYKATLDRNGKPKESVIKIKNAVISDFTVEYSAGTQSPTFFKNTAAPLSATLNVTVKETEIYTKERLREDYPTFNLAD